MNNSIKVVGVFIAILLIAGGAYVLLSGTSRVEDLSTVDTTVVAEGDGLPAATDSVDDFATAMQADVSATASVINAFDASQDVEVQTIVTSGTNLYDPENL